MSSAIVRLIRNDQRGSTSMEFGMVAVVFFMMLFSVMDIGRFFFMQHLVRTITAETARQAFIQTATGGCSSVSTNESSIKSNAALKTPFLNPAGASTFTVSCNVPTTGSLKGTYQVDVTVAYPFAAVVPFVSFLSGNITDTTRLNYAPLKG